VAEAAARIKDFTPGGQVAIQAELERRGITPLVPTEEAAGIAEDDIELESPQDLNPIACARCDQELQYVGTKRLHEGTNWGIFGELGKLFIKR